MFTGRTSVGLDVHARSVVAAAIDGVMGELIQTRLTPSHEHIRSWLSDLPGPVAARGKTDAKDAAHLARLLWLDEYTGVSIPSIDTEHARDLVRAREDACGDLMRARHRLSKLLWRQGILYADGQAWTGAHDARGCDGSSSTRRWRGLCCDSGGGGHRGGAGLGPHDRPNPAATLR